MHNYAKFFTIVVLGIFLNQSVAHTAVAQGALDFNPSSVNQSQGNDKVHALSLTKFHFISLKEFHTTLFEKQANEEVLELSEAEILNTALNSFLTSGAREELLLKALREGKSISLKFNMTEDTDETKLVRHPRKELLFRVAAVQKVTPINVEIQPLLDEPDAFKIKINKDGIDQVYNVDWAGQVARVPGRYSKRA